MRLKTGTAQVALAVASLGAGLLAVEGALRLVGWRPTRFHEARLIANTKGEEVRAGTLALLCFPSDPRGYFKTDLRDPATFARYQALGVRRLDQVRGTTPYVVEHRYNAEAFRGADIPPRRPNVRRLVMIGDSFTEGWGVHEPDVVSRLLERRLDAFGPDRWEVINCAKHNSDLPGLWETFDRILAFQPDIVVYGMVLNDPERSARVQARIPREMSPLIMVRHGPLVEGSRDGSRLLALVRDRLESRRLEAQMVEWYLDLYRDSNRRGWNASKSSIARMDRAMRARGGRFLLALWPLLVHLDRGYPFEEVHQTVARFSAEAGIAFTDLRDALRGEPTESLWVHPVDLHPNETAHRLAAEALAPVVRSLLH
jgi:lysophospholipase L1-like esterase